ncbi:MAG: CDP-alcohol phosphatidyltransferase family protein [Thermomicrobiales bacterium]|nr:CDP-alcohol phosphatidyltransferase family protein [Thermomicrobiales bacterium]
MANAITVGRLILLFIAVYVLYRGSVRAVAIAAIAIGVAILLDGLDGWVARKYNETSRLGAAFDIAGDRIAENVLWVVFADLGLIPIWVPLLMLTRGFLVDSLRAIGYGEGKTAFGKDNMMRSPLTQWLTAGRPMRLLYGWAKLLAFVFLAGLVGYQLRDASGTWLGDLYGWRPFRFAGWVCVWGSVVLSIVRGLPVIYDAVLTYGGEEKAPTGPV